MAAVDLEIWNQTRNFCEFRCVRRMEIQQLTARILLLETLSREFSTAAGVNTF